MSPKKVEGTPFDYSENKEAVYFEVADKIGTKAIMEAAIFVDGIEELEYGLSIEITIQQIPEMIQLLTNENIALYAVVPQKCCCN